MKLAAICFFFGAWLVQQMAQIPSQTWLICASLLAGLILITQTHSRFKVYFQTHSFFNLGLYSIAFLLLGICWASGFAIWRLTDELPPAWEQKTVAIEGVVASVPETTESGVRFRFDVEKVLTKNAIIPQHISLNQYIATPYTQTKESGRVG